MTRIADLAIHTSVLNNMLQTKQRIADANAMVNSGKVAQNYSGIADDSERLIDMENLRDLNHGYIDNNNIVGMRLKATQDSFAQVDTIIRDFRSRLMAFNQDSTPDPAQVKQIQEEAFRALQDIEALLNTEIDSQFLFSGSRTDFQPVDLGLTNLSDFQAKFDGINTTYPTTSTAHMVRTASVSDSVTFNAPAGTLDYSGASAANIATLSAIPVGATITLSGSGSGNNGSFTVTGNAGNVITVSGTLPGGSVLEPVSIATGNYYKGDNVTRTHRLDQDRSTSLNATASHPSFEKAIRALSNIAQGDLANNPVRTQQTLYLLDHALDSPTIGTPPFGAEVAGDLESLQFDYGFKQQLLERTIERQLKFNNFLETEAAKIEDVDQTEAIMKLLSESQALEASYQAFSRVSSLSLVNFL